VRIPRVESCERERGSEKREQGSSVQAGVIFRKLPRRKPDLRSLWPCAFAKSYLHSFSGSRLSRKHSTRLLSPARSPRFLASIVSIVFDVFPRIAGAREPGASAAENQRASERKKKETGEGANGAKKEQGETGGEKEAGGVFRDGGWFFGVGRERASRRRSAEHWMFVFN